MSLNETSKNLVCVACLSCDRNLFPVKEMGQYLSMFCRDIQLVESDEICWECRAIVHKLIHFRSRILEAQTILARYEKKMNPMQTLSRLAVNQLSSMSINLPPSTGLYDQICVKLEPETNQESSRLSELNVDDKNGNVVEVLGAVKDEMGLQVKVERMEGNSPTGSECGDAEPAESGTDECFVKIENEIAMYDERLSANDAGSHATELAEHSSKLSESTAALSPNKIESKSNHEIGVTPTPSSPQPPFVFVETKAEGKILIRSGYRYRMNRKNKNGSQIWRCCNCQSRLTLNRAEDKILTENPHSCSPDDKAECLDTSSGHGGKASGGAATCASSSTSSTGASSGVALWKRGDDTGTYFGGVSAHGESSFGRILAVADEVACTSFGGASAHADVVAGTSSAVVASSDTNENGISLPAPSSCQSPLTFTESSKGGRILWRAGWRYRRSKVNKNGSCIWQCSSTFCKATITLNTAEDAVLRETPHSCLPDFKGEEVSVVIDKCRKRVRTDSAPISGIFEQEIKSLKTEEFLDEIPSFHSIKCQLYRSRKKFQKVS